jgi:hypothetical protein
MTRMRAGTGSLMTNSSPSLMSEASTARNCQDLWIGVLRGLSLAS